VSPVHPVFALIAVLVALAVSALLARTTPVATEQHRDATIDGLRGYLAFFVFVHHGAIWYYFVRTNEWVLPPSHLYTFLGQGSVAMFFMITAFLFCRKLMQPRNTRIDWLKLYMSRLLRLSPMYVVSMLILFVVAGCVSQWTMRDSWRYLALETAEWLTFTILGRPEINSIPGTWVINAGVTWSLPYEWYFYACLPALGLIWSARSPILLSAVSVAILIAGAVKFFEPMLLLPFVGGIATAVVSPIPAVQRFATTRLASLATLAAMTLAVVRYPSANQLAPLALLTIAFTLIASGATMFGTLTNRAARALGDITYSIYLLHGIILFVAFRFIVGFDRARELSVLAHWTVVLLLAPLVVGMSWFTFHAIEQPAMQRVNAVTAWIRTITGTPIPVAEPSNSA